LTTLGLQARQFNHDGKTPVAVRKTELHSEQSVCECLIPCASWSIPEGLLMGVSVKSFTDTFSIAPVVYDEGCFIEDQRVSLFSKQRNEIGGQFSDNPSY
jgi:hypothetical protein